LWLTDERDESAVYSGVARWDGSTLFLDRPPKSPFEIQSEWHERIQPVTNEKAREILLGPTTFCASTLASCRMEPHQMNTSKLS